MNDTNKAMTEYLFNNDYDECMGIDNVLLKHDYGNHRGKKPVITEFHRNNYDKFFKKIKNASKDCSNVGEAEAEDEHEDDESISIADLEQRSRVILYEGIVHKKNKNSVIGHTSKRKLILLNDAIVVCSIHDSGMLTSKEVLNIKQIINLEKIQILNLAYLSGRVSSDESAHGFQLYTSEKDYTFICDNEGDKRIWLEEIELALFALLKDSSDVLYSTDLILGTIHAACFHGDADLLQLHLNRMNRNVDLIDQPDECGMYPLHWAAFGGSDDCINLLLEVGCSVDCLNNGLNSPLLLAAAQGHHTSILILIGCGADVLIRNLSDRDALWMAVLYGSNSPQLYDTIHVLVDAGVVLDLPDAKGSTPLHECAARNLSRPVLALVDCGANISATHERNGLTPLHLACSNDSPDPETIRCFLEKGGRPNWRDAADRTAFDMVLATHSLISKSSAKKVSPPCAQVTDDISTFSMVVLPILSELVRKGCRYNAEDISHLRPSFQDAINSSKLQWLQEAVPDTLVEYLGDSECQKSFSCSWTKDSASKSCLLCIDKFTLTNRRHHCRVCGALCCDPCSSKRIAIPAGLGETEPSSPKCTTLPDGRVCDSCYNVLNYEAQQWKTKLVKRQKEKAQLALRAANVIKFVSSDQSNEVKRGTAHNVMAEAMQGMHERGQRLQETSDRAEKMRDAATDFNKMTKELVARQKRSGW